MGEVSTYTKDSHIKWIGNIPEHWSVHTLYQLVDQVKNKNYGVQENNLLSLSYGKIKRKDINSNNGLLPASFDGYNIIEDGDIVLRLTDLQNDHTSLRVGISGERGIITSAYITLRPNKIVNSKYIYYLLHAFDLKKGFYGMGSGVRQGLNYDEVKALRVVIPPRKEQEVIVDYLDDQCKKIDSIIMETKESIDEYKKWKESIIDAVTTNGLRKNTCFKKSDIEWIEKIPENWCTARLKNKFSFGKGLPITKENLSETGVPVISYGQIHAKFNTGTGISNELIRHVPDKYLQSHPECLVKKHDILIADTSEDLEGCGNCAYVDRDGDLFAGYHTIILRSIEGRDNKYLAYLFKSNLWRSQIRTRVSGVKLFSISKKILNTTSLILPPEDEQKEIVSYLDEKCTLIDSVINEKCSLISELESYKKSLIFEVVTGKRKVV